MNEYTPPIARLYEYFDAELIYRKKKEEVDFQVSCLRDSYVMTANDPAYGLCQSGGNVEARALDAIEWEMALKDIERRTSHKRDVLSKALAMMDMESSNILQNGYNRRFTNVTPEEFQHLQVQLVNCIGIVQEKMAQTDQNEEENNKKRRVDAFKRGEDIA